MPCAFATGVDADGVAHGPIAPPPHLVHLDTAKGVVTGGTGATFPWDRARTLSGGRPFMLAGGGAGFRMGRFTVESLRGRNLFADEEAIETHPAPVPTG